MSDLLNHSPFMGSFEPLTGMLLCHISALYITLYLFMSTFLYIYVFSVRLS